MDSDLVIVVGAIFIGLPWVILHYVTQWKTAATITSDDEVLLEELFRLAKRLDERMDTVERLVASDHPGFVPHRAEPRIADDDAPAPSLEPSVRLSKGVHP